MKANDKTNSENDWYVATRRRRIGTLTGKVTTRTARTNENKRTTGATTNRMTGAATMKRTTGTKRLENDRLLPK